MATDPDIGSVEAPALAQLGVEHIAAYSPEARGRSERMFQTLQDRLVQELALASITTVEAANSFIREVDLPRHNARFAVKAEQDGSAFVAIAWVDLAEILCVQEDRQVGTDNTVAFHRLRLQIPPSPRRAHFGKARVKVRQYPEGTYAIFHGPRCIGRYDVAGVLNGAFAQPLLRPNLRQYRLAQNGPQRRCAPPKAVTSQARGHR